MKKLSAGSNNILTRASLHVELPIFFFFFKGYRYSLLVLYTFFLHELPYCDCILYAYSFEHYNVYVLIVLRLTFGRPLLVLYLRSYLTNVVFGFIDS